MYESWATLIAVPAHTGGVDLRYVFIAHAVILHRPRPHGRGGFKEIFLWHCVLVQQSPPTRAGWI